MLTCQETTTWAGLLGSTHTEQWQKEKRGDRNWYWADIFPPTVGSPESPVAKLFSGLCYISRINPSYRPSALKSTPPVRSLCDQYKHLCRRSGTSLGTVPHIWGDLPVPHTQAEGDHQVLAAYSPHPTSQGVQCSLNAPQSVPTWWNVPHGLLTSRTAQLPWNLSTGN